MPIGRAQPGYGSCFYSCLKYSFLKVVLLALERRVWHRHYFPSDKSTNCWVGHIYVPISISQANQHKSSCFPLLCQVSLLLYYHDPKFLYPPRCKEVEASGEELTGHRTYASYLSLSLSLPYYCNYCCWCYYYYYY